MTNLLFTLLFPLATLMPADRTNPISTMEKKNYYCEYCGHKFPDVRSLTSGTCSKHPDGHNRGRHKLYEGTEKSKYTCKYCGKQFPSIMVMVVVSASTTLRELTRGHMRLRCKHPLA